MPRNLPWMKGSGGSSIATSRTKKITTSKPPKRARLEVSESEGTAEDTSGTSKRKLPARAHSTSPPPEAPSERDMEEGMDRDDKYRMVEDEFLAVAQMWTVSLHAAEFKRLEKSVKARDPNTINAILRPVTIKMPASTKRRVDSLARSKAQRDAIEGLLAKNGGADDPDSDEERLPYNGTCLQSFMASPSRKAASLTQIGPIKASTRAAAGFQQPAQATKRPFPTKTTSSSPLSKSDPCSSRTSNRLDALTESEDDYDDLDAPIPAPRLQPAERRRIGTLTSQASHRLNKFSSTAQTSNLPQRSTMIQPAAVAVRATSPSPIFTDFEPLHEPSAGWRSKRFDRSRKVKEEQENENGKKKRLDIIPTFM